MRYRAKKELWYVVIATVLAFCCGIYLQAAHPLPLGLLLASTFAGLLFVGPLIRMRRGASHAAAFLILLCFCLSGATRLALQEAREMTIVPGKEADVYEGLVVESSRTMKVLCLSKPVEVDGLRVVFASPEALDIGQTVRLFGKMSRLVPTFDNPGVTSWRKVEKLEGITYRIKGKLLTVTAAHDPVSRLRRYLKKNIENSGADHQDVLKALTIGDRTAISRETNDLFVKSGTTHVLAVSGFNVSIVSGFFFFIVRAVFRQVRRFRLSGRDSRYAALCTIPFPYLFMLVAGGGVSLVRATIMATVFLVALFLEKQRHFYNTTALAALAVLLLYPHSLLTPSFQLTFMSILSIVMFARRFYPLILKARNKAVLWSVSTVASTMAATLGTAPIVIYTFCGINPFCFLHNLVAIPALGVVATVLALVGMVAPHGHYLLVVAGRIVDLGISALRSLDFGYLYPLVRPDLLDGLLYYAIVAAVLHAHRKPVATLLCFVILPLALVHAYGEYRERFNDDLKIHFIDVGLGDAALVEAPGGVRLLIDGGGYEGSEFDMGRQMIAPFLLYRKIGHIDYMINSHPHADHIGGLSHVLGNFKVSHLVTPGPFPDSRPWVDLTALAKAKGVDHTIWKKGDHVKTNGLDIEVLHPRPGLLPENLNEASLVLKLTYGEVTFLFAGDIGTDVENEMVFTGAALRSDVLKVPHHGSGSSSGLPFIYAVKPKIAVLSASGNMRGLPGPEALERFRKVSVPVLMTGRNGLIEARTDGRRIAWKTQRR